MKTEIMKTGRVLTVYRLTVPNIVIITSKISVVKKKLEEAIDSYEASNHMPNSSSVIGSSTLTKAAKAIFDGYACQTVPVTNASSSVAYRIELDMAKQGSAVCYSVIASFYEYEEA